MKLSSKTKLGDLKDCPLIGPFPKGNTDSSEYLVKTASGLSSSALASSPTPPHQAFNP